MSTFLSRLLLSALVCGTAASVSAAPVTLRFRGTADLSLFGGSATSRFAGDVTWDASMPCNGNGDDYSQCFMDPHEYDGDVPTGHFAIDEVDYSQHIAPYSRLEVFPYDFFVDFWFTPAGDPNALDIERVYLWLLSPRSEAAGNPVFDGHLPESVAFLPRLEERLFVLSGPWDEEEQHQIRAEATTLHVPEPAVAAMLVVGVAALGRRRRGRLSVRA